MTTIKTVLTTIGQAKITNAIILGESLGITQMAIGDGVIIPDASMTALANEVWRGNLTSLEIDDLDPNQIEARIVVPNNVGGWTAREVALLDDQNNTIAIGNLSPTAVEAGAVALTVTMVIAIGAALTEGITLVPAGPYLSASEKGQPSGVATLDENGLVPEAQLPSMPGGANPLLPIGFWDMAVAAAPIEPSQARTLKGTVSKISATEYRFDPDAVIATPDGAALSGAGDAIVMDGSVQSARVTIPASYGLDNIGLLGLLFANASATDADILLALSSSPQSSASHFAYLVGTGTDLYGINSTPEGQTFASAILAFAPGDNLYLSLNTASGAMQGQVNNGAPVSVGSFNLASLPSGGVRVYLLVSFNSSAPVLGDGFINFDLSTTDQGLLPFVAQGDAVAPLGVVDGNRFKVVVGGRFNAVKTQVGDIVEFTAGATQIEVVSRVIDDTLFVSSEQLGAALTDIVALKANTLNNPTAEFIKTGKRIIKTGTGFFTGTEQDQNAEGEFGRAHIVSRDPVLRFSAFLAGDIAIRTGLRPTYLDIDEVFEPVIGGALYQSWVPIYVNALPLRELPINYLNLACDPNGTGSDAVRYLARKKELVPNLTVSPSGPVGTAVVEAMFDIPWLEMLGNTLSGTFSPYLEFELIIHAVSDPEAQNPATTAKLRCRSYFVPATAGAIYFMVDGPGYTATSQIVYPVQIGGILDNKRAGGGLVIDKKTGQIGWYIGSGNLAMLSSSLPAGDYTVAMGFVDASATDSFNGDSLGGGMYAALGWRNLNPPNNFSGAVYVDILGNPNPRGQAREWEAYEPRDGEELAWQPINSNIPNSGFIYVDQQVGVSLRAEGWALSGYNDNSGFSWAWNYNLIAFSRPHNYPIVAHKTIKATDTACTLPDRYADYIALTVDNDSSDSVIFNPQAYSGYQRFTRAEISIQADTLSTGSKDIFVGVAGSSIKVVPYDGLRPILVGRLIGNSFIYQKESLQHAGNAPLIELQTADVGGVITVKSACSVVFLTDGLTVADSIYRFETHNPIVGERLRIDGSQLTHSIKIDGSTVTTNGITQLFPDHLVVKPGDVVELARISEEAIAFSWFVVSKIRPSAGRFPKTLSGLSVTILAAEHGLTAISFVTVFDATGAIVSTANTVVGTSVTITSTIDMAGWTAVIGE